MINITSAFANYNGAIFPNFTGKNATGAGSTDGTEWISAYIDNWGWGWSQALLSYMGLSPNGVTEAPGTSQIVDALGMFLPVGCPIEWNRANDPATDGLRFLLLNGQGVVRSNYPDLDAAVYVGDGNNAAVAAAGGAYYHADDAAGTIPNIAGVYLILPDRRGYAPRGLDSAGSVDPDGPSRFIGDAQTDAFQGHYHDKLFRTIEGNEIRGNSDPGSNLGFDYTSAGDDFERSFYVGDPSADGTNGTPRTSSETRMANVSTQWAVRY